MSPGTPVEIVAVVGARTTLPSRPAALPTPPGPDEIRWFGPHELAGLDRAVRRGSIRRVIFEQPSDLFDGIWSEEIEFDRWPAEVRIEFTRSAISRESVDLLARGWAQWRRRHRRRQALAGAVLSILVLAVAFWLGARPAG